MNTLGIFKLVENQGKDPYKQDFLKNEDILDQKNGCVWRNF